MNLFHETTTRLSNNYVVVVIIEALNVKGMPQAAATGDLLPHPDIGSHAGIGS